MPAGPTLCLPSPAQRHRSSGPAGLGSGEERPQILRKLCPSWGDGARPSQEGLLLSLTAFTPAWALGLHLWVWGGADTPPCLPARFAS